MKLRSNLLVPGMLALACALTIAACSSDSSGPTNNNGPAMHMKLSPGDFFTYDRWMLDENNNHVGDPWKYRVTYLDNKDVFIEAYNDFVYLKEEDVTNSTSPVRLNDTTAIRTNNQGNLYMYGFQNGLYVTFFNYIKTIDPTATVDNSFYRLYNQWDLIGDFNDDNGDAHAPGYQWNFTHPDMVPFNFKVTLPVVGQQDVSVLPTLTGTYDGYVGTTEVKSKTISLWQVTLTLKLKVNADILGPDGQDFIITEVYKYSDDPDGIISLSRKSASIDLSPLPAYTLNGEDQVLSTFVKF